MDRKYMLLLQGLFMFILPLIVCINLESVMYALLSPYIIALFMIAEYTNTYRYYYWDLKKAIMMRSLTNFKVDNAPRVAIALRKAKAGLAYIERGNKGVLIYLDEDVKEQERIARAERLASVL